MQTLIKREYLVTQSCDLTEDDAPFDYQAAHHPDDPQRYVSECETLNEAIDLMQRCFESERQRFPDTRPEEFRIEIFEHHYLHLRPSS